MHDLRFVIDNLELVKQRQAARHKEFDFDRLEQLASERKGAIQAFESLRAEQKSASGGMKSLKPGSEEFVALRTKLKEMSTRTKELEETRKQVEQAINDHLLLLPNLLDEVVPAGASEEDNPVVREGRAPADLDFEPKDHVDIGADLGIIDFEAAAKVTGARFVFLRGAASKLNRALIQFMLDLHTTEHGYEEVLPPFMVARHSMVGTGQLPKFEEDAFRADDYFLIPTAEVPVTNFYRDTLMEELPETIKFCAYTPCFRREAGSAGKDTRGMIRQHQFDKVELVKFCRPEDSEAEHAALVKDAETVLERLELPFRTVELCGGDVGFSARRCFDLEVWLPSQNRYREISSCSNFGDFQARRASIRFRNDDGKPTFAHTLNGSGLAVGRTLVALLENFQQADGSVAIPDALRPYTGFDRIA